MLKNQEFVAIDLETSGKYPLDAQICEVSLIRFKGDEIIDRYNSLVKPDHQMGEAVIKIHHITNEMVEGAPKIEEVIDKIHGFIGDLPLLGHNLPFDLGFLCYEFERAGLKLNSSNNYCTSLLSLSLLPKLSSHRLKYLSQHFGIDEEPNHRAEQDAIACMNVFNKLVKDLSTVAELNEAQNDPLLMESFSVKKLEENVNFTALVSAVKSNLEFELMYSKGSKKNKWRSLNPKGLVLKTKEEGFLVACDPGEIQTKRFMLNKIVNSKNK